jgi:CRISPR/Cas system-associated endonuclease Cas1
MSVTRLLLADAGSIEEIMGYERTATREYFRSCQEQSGPD